ncbi:glycosyltransferase family A protein [Galbibacter sp. PAP.153]|uniref:glycosyltransferase family A protein n=1 Tax=Galbibacter sp. PAP.153 TaxID=3104623 RepID=UPI0030085CE6
MSAHFYIICTCRNVENWIEKNINSVKNQHIKSFTFLIWFDNPTDDSVNIANRCIGNDVRFKIFVSKEQVYATEARWNLLKSIKGAKPTDIIILLDGDDWLYSNNTLSILFEAYKENEIITTHGNYISTNNIVCSWSKDYSHEIKSNNTFRESPWIATHLRTFKYGILKYVNEEILKDSSGDFFKSATDMALFLPILELSGKYSMFINEVLYVYNHRNNLANSNLRIANQRKSEKEIRQKKKLLSLNKDIVKNMIVK